MGRIGSEAYVLKCKLAIASLRKVDDPLRIAHAVGTLVRDCLKTQKGAYGNLPVRKGACPRSERRARLVWVLSQPPIAKQRKPL